MAANKKMTPSTPSFSIGDEVVLVGLQKSPHLNNQIGIVAGNIKDGRYAVATLIKGAIVDKKIAIKPKNLKKHSLKSCFTATNEKTSSSSRKSFSVGDQVMLVGLQESPHLNNQICAVFRDMQDNGRYPVMPLLQGKMMDTSKKMAIRPENLELKEKEALLGACFGCEKMCLEKQLQVCEKCHYAQYCSQECQHTHWREEHKKDCKTYQKGRLAKHDESKLPTNPQKRFEASMANAVRYHQKGKHAHAERLCRANIEGPPHESILVYALLVDTIIAQDPGPDRLNEAITLLQKAVTIPTVTGGSAEKHTFLWVSRRLGDLLLSERHDSDGAERLYKAVLKENCDDDFNTLLAKRGLEKVEKYREMMAEYAFLTAFMGASV